MADKSFTPGQVTITADDIVISDWRVVGTGADELRREAVDWALDRILAERTRRPIVAPRDADPPVSNSAPAEDDNSAERQRLRTWAKGREALYSPEGGSKYERLAEFRGLMDGKLLL